MQGCGLGRGQLPFRPSLPSLELDDPTFPSLCCLGMLVSSKAQCTLCHLHFPLELASWRW